MGVGDENRSAARRAISKSVERKKVSKSAASKTGRSARGRDPGRNGTGSTRHEHHRMDTATGTFTGGSCMDECSSSDDRTSGGTIELGDSELSDVNRRDLETSPKHAMERLRFSIKGQG